MKLNNLIQVLTSIVDTRNIDQSIVINALEEALLKAFRKHIDVSDAYGEVVINPDTDELHLYRKFEVVDDVEDDALQIETGVAQSKDPSLQAGDFYKEEFNIAELGRSAAQLAKQVLKQKIREAEKQGVYDEYIDLKDEMINGIVQSVEERFTIVNLGKTMAILPKSQQIPNEFLREGQQLKVVITNVSKDTKGAQVVVSRGDANLVKRLFEKEVPEIAEGIVQIKAIAREAGERTKMAVYSHNDEVDAIGACIGPRGSRVQVVIEELKGEKIDIFEWSENTIELIKNALAPAEVVAVFNAQEKKGLVVVVEDKQLSLAIGKGGKNARLAVKLTKQKIDIKPLSEVVALGLDYMGLMTQYQKQLEEERQQQLIKKQQAMMASYLQQQENNQAQENEDLDTFEDEFYENIDAEFESEENDLVSDETISLADSEDTSLLDETVVLEEKNDELPAASENEMVTSIENKEEKEEAEVEAVVEESQIEKPVKKSILERKQQFVSKFEALADVAKTPKPEMKKKRKRKHFNDHDEDELDDLKRVNTAELLQNMNYDIKPTYTEEELADIEDDSFDDWYDDIDYDEFDDYYDEKE